VPQLASMLRSHTHHHHPTGDALRQEITVYAQDLRQASILKSSTDPAQFADRIYTDVLAV
jgi:NitT/TauT family transport system substrate-binding protein